MSAVSRSIDRVGMVFDDESLVADAGLLAAGALLGRLGVEVVVDRTVRHCKHFVAEGLPLPFARVDFSLEFSEGFEGLEEARGRGNVLQV